MHVKYSKNSSIGAIGVRVCRVKAVKTTEKNKQISWSAEKNPRVAFCCAAVAAAVRSADASSRWSASADAAITAHGSSSNSDNRSVLRSGPSLP